MCNANVEKILKAVEGVYDEPISAVAFSVKDE